MIATPTSVPPSDLAPALKRAEATAGRRTRRWLLIALVLSLSVHLAITWWPVDMPQAPESTPLTATLTELPPPPVPSAAAPVPAPPKPKPKPRRTPAVPPPLPAPVEAPPEPAAAAMAEAPEPAPAEAPTPASGETPEAPPAMAEVTPGAVTDGKTLPPRVDLAYKVFYGTRGFLIGEAVYRFEHAGNRYRIATVGAARGLAALVLRGQGKIESRGLITHEGLQPLTFRVERGGPDRVEMATFDWEAGLLTMHENKTAPLDLPTFDPLSLMWQYYFTPPTDSVVTFTVGTPRRIIRYTMTREGEDTIPWQQGTLDTERWHRQSEDGKTDAYVWLAPKLRHIPVKMRVSNTERGTIEVLLDSIRVDEAAANFTSEELAIAPSVPEPPASYVAPSPTAQPEPGETFPTMTP